MMEWFAYIAFIYLAFRFLVTLLNFWYKPLLKPGHSTTNGLVSICVPVRNEAHNLPGLLTSLLQQDYPELEIVFYDDMSDDGTWDILQQYSENNQNIKAIRGTALPLGWMGKNNACYTMSNHAVGGYLLFVDADVRFSKDAVSTLVVLAKKRKLNLLSVFPKQIMKSTGEKLVVPLMNLVLLSLLPFFLVPRRNYASFSAANGQVMLFDAGTYHRFKYHRLHFNNPVEDIAIARGMKKMGLRTAVYLGNKSISCRMYRSFNEAVNGFKKNVFYFFGNSGFFVFLHVVCTTFGALFAFYFLSIHFFIFYLALLILQRFLVAILSGFNILWFILNAIPQHFAFLWVILSATLDRKNGKVIWKNRTYQFR